jgi:hypothetical protein
MVEKGKVGLLNPRGFALGQSRGNQDTARSVRLDYLAVILSSLLQKKQCFNSG